MMCSIIIHHQFHHSYITVEGNQRKYCWRWTSMLLWQLTPLLQQLMHSFGPVMNVIFRFSKARGQFSSWSSQCQNSCSVKSEQQASLRDALNGPLAVLKFYKWCPRWIVVVKFSKSFRLNYLQNVYLGFFIFCNIFGVTLLCYYTSFGVTIQCLR